MARKALGPTGSRRRRWLLLLCLTAAVAAGVFFIPGALAQLLDDSGTVNVIVPNNTTSVVNAPTADGALVSYFGDSDTTFGSSGTGTFDPFVRLQANPTEQGYNTNGTTEFDTKVGTWTHAEPVSSIPVVKIGGKFYWELFNDINENNSTPYISLNKVEVYFTSDPNLTGYPFTGNADLEYSFSGDVLIKDVNQGSGRADLRYDIPIADIPIPAGCAYNPASTTCSTYFVLYSKWGTSSSTIISPAHNYGSDGGFEEWKVRIYPVAQPTLTTSATGAAIGGSIGDSATLAGAAAGAGGTITFKAYGPETSATCAAADLVFTSSPVSVSGNGTYGPVSFTPTLAGDYYWVASYSGDPPNTLSASTSCGDTGEKSTVTPKSPTINTTANPSSATVGAVLKDSATLSGGYNPTGTITFTLYDPSNNLVDTETVSVSGNGTYSTPTGYTSTVVGTYQWVASYSGDTNNNPVSSNKGDEPVTVTGGQGCTPGFWKNHTQYWDGFTDPVVVTIRNAIAGLGAPYTYTATSGTSTTGGLTTEKFADIFGLTTGQMTAVGLDPNMTMLTAINLGGGGYSALARMAVAGLLSSASVAYPYSPTQVLTMVHNAITTTTLEPTLDNLTNANNLQCPLN